MGTKIKKTVNTNVSERLASWGQIIRAQRVTQRITEIDFCRRIGISKPTLVRLQKGAPGIAADTYLEALQALGFLDMSAPQMPISLSMPAPATAKIIQRVRRSRMELDNDF